MKELIVILLVIVVLLALTAFRHRRQIQTAIGVWRMFRKMREASRPSSDQQIPASGNSGDVELIKCARCDSWTPKNQALKFSKGTFYCSSKCVSEAMNVR